MNKMKSVLSTALLASLMGSGSVMAEAMVSGVVEVELTSAEDSAGNTARDIAVATVELGIDAEVSEDVSVHVLALYEDDGLTNLNVDEAIVTMKLSEAVSISAGSMYVPFGKFDTNVISDPMALEMGETHDTAIMLETNTNNLTTSFYLFKGDSKDAGAQASLDDTDLGYGFNLAFVKEEMLEVGFGYVSNIADSDFFEGLTSTDVQDYVAGADISVMYTTGPVTLIAEHMTAMDDFVASDLGGDIAVAAQPAVSHLEVAFDLGEGQTVALAYGMTAEAVQLGMNETSIAAAYSFSPVEGATLAFEYATADDYSLADGGSGTDTNQITVQLAAEF